MMTKNDSHRWEAYIPPSVLAVCRDCYIYEGCRNFRKFELLADIDFNEEEEE